MESSALGEQLNRCEASRGPLLALQRAAKALHAFIAEHFVTTRLAVIALLIIVASPIL